MNGGGDGAFRRPPATQPFTLTVDQALAFTAGRQHEQRPTGHPVTAYIREDDVVAAVDRWLAQSLDPGHLDQTVAALMSSAHEADAAAEAEAQRCRDAAQRTAQECEHEVSADRAALKEGADPAAVAKWITEAQAKLLARWCTEREPIALLGPKTPKQNSRSVRFGERSDRVWIASRNG